MDGYISGSQLQANRKRMDTSYAHTGVIAVKPQAHDITAGERIGVIHPSSREREQGSSIPSSSLVMGVLPRVRAVENSMIHSLHILQHSSNVQEVLQLVQITIYPKGKELHSLREPHL
ncbi:hypothetical protein LIER_00518 [Lithospermum erythrorhizon]|uniref:Uncharacterized protein n=1 Tax=Lithospermum erythrorhizon TaxID=34254 RepID=A0AAV3NHQ0_LITER